MRVLVATTAGEGHFWPIVPFAHAVAEAGHDVEVAAPESFAKSVADAGLAHLPVDDVPPDLIGPIMSRLPELSNEEANATVIGEIFGHLDTKWALPRMRANFTDWRPDVVLREPCEFSSYIAAEEAGVPHVYVGIGLASLDELARDKVRDPLTELGAPDDDSKLWNGPRATMLPASFERPDASGPADTRRYAPRQPETSPLPDWWPDDDRPLVYVTFGSVAASVGFYPEVYRAALQSIDGPEARVLVTTGRAGDPAELGPLPQNVHVEQWVTQADVLAHAAAVVGHGGFGTTFGALAAGVPTVVLPLFASDQFDNAERVAAIGAGVGLSGPEAAGEVGGALRQVLSDGSFGAAARRVADEIAGQEPIDSFAEWLASIA